MSTCCTTLSPDNDCNRSHPKMEDRKPYDEVVTPIGRAIYYVLAVSSLIGLAYSIGALWPSKREDGSLVEIPNSKYLAVVLTSLYAIGLARTLFFDRPPPSHKIGPHLEWFYPFCVYMTAFVIAFTCHSDFGVVFAISVITCGIAIFQLSHPVEEFNVGKSLCVIMWSVLICLCFTEGKDAIQGFICGFSAVFMGVFMVVVIRDLETAQFCSQCNGRVTSK
ncbi:hypothetical protein ISN45_Aa03g006840 [Arabidopsis thaliana x Arabidopsis arenosa]|uniref:Uncharacterized protein n=1 Tax=Arabidopsis thaliana x Arabidopsis arenosa TaxID=1240361 RepID=A0A8T2ANZ6_9BRAS|nr:hypothetical protein ISN45_Aa03g006840 [Arabidopsis thaliana x Arabidopsis arenosa]